MTDPKDIAQGIAPCWGNGIAGPKECDEVYQCELHFRLVAALVEFGEEVLRNQQLMSFAVHNKLVEQAEAEGYRRGWSECWNERQGIESGQENKK